MNESVRMYAEVSAVVFGSVIGMFATAFGIVAVIAAVVR